MLRVFARLLLHLELLCSSLPTLTYSPTSGLSSDITSMVHIMCQLDWLPRYLAWTKNVTCHSSKQKMWLSSHQSPAAIPDGHPRGFRMGKNKQTQNTGPR